MLTFGSYTIIVKPAAAVLAAAVTIGVVAPTIARLASRENVPTYGYVNPESWRFDTRGVADAKIQVFAPDGSESAPAPAHGIPMYNSDKGFDINVFQTGAANDTVFLRNAFSRQQSDFKDPVLSLTFEAKSEQNFPVLFTVRDGRPGMDRTGPLWSHEMNITGAWKRYRLEIPVSDLQKTPNLDYILAVHLGNQAGEIGFRDIHVR